MNIDLGNLTFGQFFAALLIVALIDWAFAVASAVANGSFTLALIADVIRSHVLMRVFPIAATAFIALAVPQAQSAHDVIWLAAVGMLALYMAQTLGSIAASVQSVRQPFTNEPVPPPDAAPAPPLTGG